MKQTSVALSSAEAEYIALYSAAQEVIWLRRLLPQLKNQPHIPTLIGEDNQSAIALSQNSVYHGSSKHINLRYHFIREQVCAGTIKLQYCSSELMIADTLIKGLARVRFETLRKLTGSAPFIKQSEKEC